MSDAPHNPYAPPQSPLLTPEGPPAPADIAGAGRRFANYWIDSLAVNLLAVAWGVAQGAIADTAEEPGVLLGLAIGFGISLGYYTALEALTGRTLGKLVTGTRVVSASGGPASFRQVLGRSFSRLIPFEMFSFLGEPPVGWHDSLPGTRVVRVRRA